MWARAIRRRASASGRRRVLGLAGRSDLSVRAGPVVIQITGDSGSGKTLVVEHCVRRLVARRLRVAVVKHSHHSPDVRGKDTFRALAAGATLVVFASNVSFVTFRGDPRHLVRLLPVDVVLVEGYSRHRLGSIRLRIRRPSDRASVVRRILEAVPKNAARPFVVVNGRRRAADPVWRFVLGVMESRGANEVRLPS